jgi:beta-glucosidase-like glycosyl hydrolase
VRLAHPDRVTSLGAFLVPELWWDPQAGFSHLEALIDDAFELGVQAFHVRGGPAEAVRALTADLHRRAPEPLLIAMETSAGVGSLVPEMTPLPPLRALAALRDSDAIRRAALLTARQLRALGVNWGLAPVADLAHPGTFLDRGARALGEDPQRVAEDVVTWIDACQSQGVLACARHFPGVGRAMGDPERAAGVIETEAGTLWATDLVPFRGAIDTGVASALVGAVAFPGLDRRGVVATHSAPLIGALLRDELAFDGLIVGARADGRAMGGPEGAIPATVDAVRAGCDLVLASDDLGGAVEALDAAVDQGLISTESLEASAQRRRFWSAWAVPRETREPTLDDLLWARQVADLVVHPVRGAFVGLGPVIEVETVMRDEAHTSLHPFLETLRGAGHEVRLRPSADPRIGDALIVALDPARRAVVVFGPPEVARAVSGATEVLCAWSADRAMQEGVARRLL